MLGGNDVGPGADDQGAVDAAVWAAKVCIRTGAQQRLPVGDVSEIEHERIPGEPVAASQAGC